MDQCFGRLPQLVAANVGLFIGVFAVPAQAEWWINGGSGFLVPGYIHSETWGAEPASGNGLELTYDYYPEVEGPFWPTSGVGVLAQWERYQSPGHDRFALGAQFVAPLYGLELAYAQREGAGDRRTTHGIQLAPFVSLGVLSLAARATLPVAPDEGGYGAEFGFTIGVKIPLLLHGEGFDLSFPHGRPLTLGDRAVVAMLSSSPRPAGWAAPLHSSALDAALDALDAAERGVVADHWVLSALEEHASIASFSRLALELLSLGAPPNLVEGAHRAALDELGHARSCLAVARAARPDVPDLGPFPDATRAVRPIKLEKLAVATFREGCLGEARAARALQRAAKEARCKDLADVLGALAADEERHAEFAWQVLEWCFAEAGEAVALGVADALAKELASVPNSPARALPLGFGRLGAQRERLIWRAVARQARQRWQRILDPRTADAGGTQGQQDEFQPTPTSRFLQPRALPAAVRAAWVPPSNRRA